MNRACEKDTVVCVLPSNFVCSIDGGDLHARFVVLHSFRLHLLLDPCPEALARRIRHYDVDFQLIKNLLVSLR